MLKKRLTAILTAALILALLPVAPLTAEAGTAENEPAAVTDTSANPKNVVQLDNGVLTYYDADGNVAIFTGWKTIGSNTYWANENGSIAKSPCWIKCKKTTAKNVRYYYNKKTKKWQEKQIRNARTKIVRVKETRTVRELWMFAEDGRLIRKKGLFKYNGKEYYGLGQGRLKTGWAAVGNQAMYFNKKNCKTGTVGSMAKNTTVGHLKVPKNGRLGKAYALGVRQLDKIGWKLTAAYEYSYRIRYRDRRYRRKTTEEYAVRGFSTGTGNCYVMASTFYVMAKLLGYQVFRVEGKVAGINPHSWTVIREKGKELIYDPNFTNETGRNGWKIWYRKRGTWRYTNYRKVDW